MALNPNLPCFSCHLSGCLQHRSCNSKAVSLFQGSCWHRQSARITSSWKNGDVPRYICFEQEPQEGSRSSLWQVGYTTNQNYWNYCDIVVTGPEWFKDFWA